LRVNSGMNFETGRKILKSSIGVNKNTNKKGFQREICKEKIAFGGSWKPFQTPLLKKVPCWGPNLHPLLIPFQILLQRWEHQEV